MERMPDPAKRVLLAAPRGYCAGVDRAVITVEKALELYGAPVYVRKQIVHNKHVVETLEERGADLRRGDRRGARGRHRDLLRARGRARSCTSRRPRRQLKTIDATCPLVTKVHHEARRFAADDYDILLIGHEGHEEVVGTSGEAPDHIHLVDGPDGVDGVHGARPGEGRLAVADHAVGRRDHGDGASAPRAVPRAARPAERRHLLRHPEPPGRGEGDRRRSDLVIVVGSTQLVELGAAGRGRARVRGERQPPRRQGRRDRRRVARRRDHGRA